MDANSMDDHFNSAVMTSEAEGPELARDQHLARAYRDALQTLMPRLQCPSCHSPELLELLPGSVAVSILTPVCDEHLHCPCCNTAFPVTEDYIPIMWDDDLRQVYSEVEASESSSASTIIANVAVYDSISNDYHQFTRQEQPIAQRMQNGVQGILEQRRDSAVRATESEPLCHVDFGCGPGHVIGWLKDFGLQHIGVDVSINNLRNAREHTGCLVVCGNACNMPFADASIDIVTESSVLHHIYDWKSAVAESLRICKAHGGIVFDSEPSRDQLAWSPLAVGVYNMRFPAYKVMSLFLRGKYIFRDGEQARLNLEAEIHHQPGTGIPVEEVESMFEGAGFTVKAVRSPTPLLESKATPNWKGIVMNLLSARNPWNPKHGGFTTLGFRNEVKAA
jgi:ubiquinone/menaquinone biosynthesis C-methylase UbiE/uncharacterized protein YbaR (Trm112 family)